MNDANIIRQFPDYLFWDVDKASIDMEANAPYVVRRVLERGRMEDWRLLVTRYGLPRIVEICMHLRTLEPKALSFIAAISFTPKELFRCYTQRPSSETHWEY